MITAVAHDRNLSADRWFWMISMIVLAVIAFTLLARERHNHFGTITYGVLPEFTALNSEGKSFDYHQLKGQLSAVVITDKNLPEDVAFYFHRFSQVTAMGRKYLHSIVMTDGNQGVSDKWVQYLRLSQEDFSRLYTWRINAFKGDVLLIDQNGVIRGVFDLQDKAQRLLFESAVKGIL